MPTLSSDGRLLASKHGPLCVTVHEISTMKRLAIFRAKDQIAGLAFRTNETLVIQSSESSPEKLSVEEFSLWDWHRDKVLATNRERRSVMGIGSGIVMSPDGSKLLSVERPTVPVWSGDLNRKLGELPVPDIRWAAFSPDGHRIVTVGDDPVVRIWDADRSELLLTLMDSDGHRGGVAFTSDGRIVAGRTAGGFTIWESKKPPCRECPGAR
jgi:WD40 repeat protein